MCSRQLTTAGCFGLLIVLTLAASHAAAQSACLSGTVTMALGVNGKITVCPQYAAKVPELQKQIDEMQKTLKGNEALLLEITHSARGVNALARNVDENRQIELLQSFSKQLRGFMSANQQKTQTQIAELANKMDTLEDLITQKREDEKTALQTQTALNGQLGDAIAALNLAGAQQQLDSIQAKLNQISQDTHAIKETLEAQAAQENAAREEEQKKEEALNEDPDMYTRAQIMPMAGLGGGHRFMVFFYSRPPLYPPFINSTFSIAFHKDSGEAWRIDATDKQVAAGGELWRIDLNELGDKAAFCFVAHDKQSGRLKEWMQRYNITASTTSPGGANFVPDGDAKMWLTDGGPCDGVTEVRNQATPITAEEYEKEQIAKSQQNSQQQVQQMQEQIQQRMAQLQSQYRQMAPRPENFARITASALKRDNANGGKWQVKVNIQPFRAGTTFYNEQVQANLVDASGGMTPLDLSNPQLFVNIESRYAWVDPMGTKAVVCLTAKSPSMDKPYRMTQWFNVSVSRVYWNDGGAQVPGAQASFLPAQPATLTEASDAPCQ